MEKIEVGDKWQVLDSTSKFAHNIMTVTKILKDGRKLAGRRLEREDVIYFKTMIPVDGYTEHDARAWWFFDYCIKVK